MSNESSSFSVTITMSDDTVTALKEDGFQLFGFKGVSGPVSREARPLVWFKASEFSGITTVKWTEQYGCYTSTTTDIAANTVIEASDTKLMALGKTMNVGDGGIGTVVNTGDPGLLAISNQDKKEYTCGVTVMNPFTKVNSPICAFPLFIGAIDNFAPIEIIYLMFATDPVDTGTVIEQSFDRGISVDLTGVTAPVSLSFDIGPTGWSGPGFSTSHPANTALLPLLVNPVGVGVAAL